MAIQLPHSPGGRAALVLGVAGGGYILYRYWKGSSSSSLTGSSASTGSTTASGAGAYGPTVDVYNNEPGEGSSPSKSGRVGEYLQKAAEAERKGNHRAANEWTHKAWLAAGKPKGLPIFQEPYNSHGKVNPGGHVHWYHKGKHHHAAAAEHQAAAAQHHAAARAANRAALSSRPSGEKAHHAEAPATRRDNAASQARKAKLDAAKSKPVRHRKSRIGPVHRAKAL